MLQCVDQIEVSINERLDHLTILLIDSEQLASLVKDEEKKRNLVKNFRIIKSAEKARIATEHRYLKYLEKHGSNLSKSEVMYSWSQVEPAKTCSPTASISTSTLTTRPRKQEKSQT